MSFNNAAWITVVKALLVRENYLPDQQDVSWTIECQRAWFAYCDRKGHNNTGAMPTPSDFRDSRVVTQLMQEYETEVARRLADGIDLPPAPNKPFSILKYLNAVILPAQQEPEQNQAAPVIQPEIEFDYIAERQKAQEAILRSLRERDANSNNNVIEPRSNSKTDKENRKNRFRRAKAPTKPDTNAENPPKESTGFRARG